VLAAHKPVAGAVVRLEPQNTSGTMETRTDAHGNFTLSGLRAGNYQLTAEKAGLQIRSVHITVSPSGCLGKIDLILNDAQSLPQTHGRQSSASALPMQFADKPNFTVAGITDWTAVGGHGSDSILRTSEALTRETLALKPEEQNTAKPPSPANANESEARLRAALARSPGSFQANYQLGEFYLRSGKFRESVPLLEKASSINPSDVQNQYDLAWAYDQSGNTAQALALVNQLLASHNSADLHRLAGQLNEKLGRPLVTVREFEQAVRLDPSEQNYFEWGSELLFHRAIWQAQQVFSQGAKAYPHSSRMLTALGTALFAGALYDKSALSLCQASDLDPANIQPYIFMGKVQMAAPNPLPCIETKLARFVREQPQNYLANYLYAMAILKRHQLSADPHAIKQAEGLLQNAVHLNNTCGEAYLQLGILSYSRHNVDQAINYYQKAIASSPQLGESYYRLGVAYDRLGKTAKAQQEFQLHDEIEKKQAEAVDNRRREIKQFRIVDSGKPANVPAQ
jgi:tetratricopeptide (TPR) repeat protein